jgi:hypothetical protein
MLLMQHGRAYDVAGELSSSVSPFATRCSGAPLQQVQRLCFPFSHGLLWWNSTTTTDHRADAAELHRICPRSALAVLPQLMQTAVELHRSLLLFSAIPVAEELFSNGNC